jgi:hypothetical protein
VGARLLLVALGCIAAASLPPAASAALVTHDADGVAYRSFEGVPRFHPLLSFQALNGHMDANRRVKAARLAGALLRRARRDGNALVWEYPFRYQGQPAGWRSGMAQAVAAEALARAGYRRAAHRAFLAVDDLLARPEGVLWIKLYSFSSVPVLNAQLQAALSLRRYARIVGDRRAARLSARLLAAADVLFPQFETACWSRYSLQGREAPASYHRYVGELLMRVARRTAAWRTRAARIYASQRRPVLSQARAPRTLYPYPVDGFRDRGLFAFSLSKCAWVTLHVGHHRFVRAWFPPGRHEIAWRPRGTPGNYKVRLTARDADGRTAQLRLRDLVVRRDYSAPRLAAEVDGPRLYWRAYDRTTPWVRMAVQLTVGRSRVTLPLGRRALKGRAFVPTLPWSASGVLVVADSSGNATRVPLGEIGPLGRIALGATLST